MPLTLNSKETIVLDTAKITQFTVAPEGGAVIIHYAVGYVDSQGQFVAKRHENTTFKGVEFESSLYDAVKIKLYDLLDSRLNVINI